MPESSLFDLEALGKASSSSTPARDSDAEPDPGMQAETPAPATQTRSLYRKYRPQTFRSTEFFGQQHIVHTLQNAVALDRVAHAYLFCGPRGTGKTTTARLTAKAVNCLDPDPYTRPCNTCQSCVAINRNATTDVIEIDAASNRGIDDIRDLRERVKYAPTQLRTKFYIIDEAHQITGAAANAFLKTLEEPPAHTKFILATTDPEELLQTIVSRCQRFDFRKIDMESMTLSLRRIAGLEHIEIDDAAIISIARHATGSLRDAQGLLDQVAVYRENRDEGNSTVTVETVRQVLGVSSNDRVERIVEALADHDPGAGLASIASAVEDGDDVRQLALQLTGYVRLLLHERAGSSPDADDTARKLASRFSLQDLTDLTRLLVDIDYKVKHAAFPQLPLELAVVDGATLHLKEPPQPTGERRERQPDRTAESTGPVTAPPAFVERRTPATPKDESTAPRTSLRDRVRGNAPPGIQESPVRPTAPEQRLERDVVPPSGVAPGSSHPVPDTVTGPAVDQPTAQSTPTNIQDRPAANGTVTLEMIVDRWSRIRADVKAVNRRIEALLQQIDPAAVTGSRLILQATYEFHRNRVNGDDARLVIEDVVERLTGTRLQVTCVSREEASTLRSDRPAVADEPPVAIPSDPPEPDAPPDTSAASPSAISAESAPVKPSGVEQAERSEDDLTRLNAARNIFDADIVEER